MPGLTKPLLVGSLEVIEFRTFQFLFVFVVSRRRMAQHTTTFQAQGSSAAMTHLQQHAVQLDCNEPPVIVLVTLAGNEYYMPANFAHYEDLSQLEDDVVGFLPTVADVEVFGCEVDLLMPDTKLSLRDPIHSTLF